MNSKIFFILLICVLSISSSIFADGFIHFKPRIRRFLPSRPAPMPVKPQFMPVKYHRVKVDIVNQVATTTIDQVFLNETDVDVEGTYIFPLPEDSSVSNFSMYMNGEKIEGKIYDKDKARKIYEDIVRTMKDPGLLEYMGRNMFKARVYPIPKHGEVRIGLVYQQTLKMDDGMCRYEYPLDTERFSPKPLKDCSIAVNIKSQVPIKSLYSPTHNVDTKIDMKEAVCGYEETNVKPDKNFVMYYTVSQKDLGLNLLTFKEKGKDGYFLLMMSPGEYESKPIPKDILFIMDTSGSMKGKKMKQAREALKFCVNSLAKDDNFNIISFATGINTFEKNLQQADSKKVDEAIEFIEKLEARGGTNINDALKIGLKMFSKSTNPRMIVFLTDGEPTVGMTDMKDIVKNIKKSNKTNTRIFVFGVGNNVNTHLLDKIAQNNKGVPEYVIPKENIELKVSSFYKKISQPVISDIELDFGKIKTSDIYPIILPDVFQGTQLIVLGRYTKSGASAITLSGNVGKEQKEYVFEDTFTADSEKNDFIPRIWASRKIGYLVSEIRLKGENKELIDEVVKLSKEFGIMTPYTSFLVLEKSQKMDRWELSENVSRSIKRKGQARKMAMDSFSGSNAVRESKSIQSMRQTNVAVRSTVNSVKSIGSKTFFLKYGGIWTDSNYKDQLKTKKIKYMSTEFFQLLKDIPELGKYFVLGSKLIVIYKEQAYQVVE